MTKRIYRKILIYFLAIIVVVSSAYYVEYLKNHIPDNIYVEPYKVGSVDLNVPFIGTIGVYNDEKEVAAASVNLMQDFSISSAKKENYQVKVKLLGIFDIKTVNICVTEPKCVVAAGIPIGIHLETKGVMVVDIGNIMTAEGEITSPSKDLLENNDYILSANGILINSKNELVDVISKSIGEIDFEVMRNSEIINVSILPVSDESGQKRIGAWIRDDCQGLGTLTYVDENMNFGALGHAICEENTGKVVSIKDGYIYTAKIWSIIKGKKGKPGEVVGSINYGDETFLGQIESNKNNGIYGIADVNVFAYVDDVYLKTAFKQDVNKGRAYIRSFVSGEIIDYEIEIEALSYAESEKNKGIVFNITDKKLLEITNGIVQGMSGSPIIQNGKVVGAVTHVFVNEPSKGYGIFIENMY